MMAAGQLLSDRFFRQRGGTFEAERELVCKVLVAYFAELCGQFGPRRGVNPMLKQKRTRLMAKHGQHKLRGSLAIAGD